MISPERFNQQQTSQVGNVIGPIPTANVTIHTKGSWFSAIASTSFDAFYAAVTVYGVATAATATAMLVDIGYDPAAGTSYTVVIPNLLAGGSPIAVEGRRTYLFPVFIPKGSQVAARCQALISADGVVVGIRLIGGHNRSNPFPHRGEIKDYGTNTATSNGTAMANSAADTKSAWTQLGADTTRRHSGLVVATAGIGTTIDSNRHYTDIGVDPAGGTTYTVVIPDYETQTNTGEGVLGSDPYSGLLSIDIPSGAAIAARNAATVINTGTQLAIAVYAF